MSKKAIRFFIFSAIVIVLCLFTCIGAGVLTKYSPDIYQYYIENSSLKVGDIAPDFELPTLDGEAVHLSQYKGQPVLLSIGASWCPDCRVEAPLLQDLHERHSQLIVLMVDSKESPKVVQAFVDEFSITFPILLDQDGSISNLYQIFAIPTELFIDSEGIIRARMIESVNSDLLAENLLLVGIQP